jgi:vitamin K-dependent gamma-carboxylase
MTEVGAGGLRSRLSRPVSSGSLGALRALFGLVMLYSLTRFSWSGWIEELWLKPRFFFQYEFAPWARVYGPQQVYAQVALAWVGALGVTLGLYWRWSMGLLLFNFIYLQLIDLTNYLNHYYFVACLGLVLLTTPAGASLSLDALRSPHTARAHVPAWCVWLPRFQLGVVYTFAALAKAQTDWLLHAQPLSIWLGARLETPLLGDLFGAHLASPLVALLFSWAGLIYDATITWLLLWRRSRPLAYLAVIGFHGATWLLFDIGVFPLVMTLCTTIFFEPDWPQRLASRLTARPPAPPAALAPAPPPAPVSRLTCAALGVWVVFHVVFPMRAWALGGDPLWDEVGMRYSWRVMVREKMGSVTYRARRLSDGRVWEVSPLRYLEPRQLSEMSGQPDMIAQLARHIRSDFLARGLGDVEVFADVWVSLNGRPPAPLVSPVVDLSRLSERVGVRPSEWLTSRPDSPPLSAWR